MNKKLLLIGLAVIHLSAASLIIASSSSTTSSSDKPKKSYSTHTKLLCLLCDKKKEPDKPNVYSIKTINPHIRNYHQRRFQCPHCPKISYADLVTLNTHLKTHGAIYSTTLLADILVAQGLAAHAQVEGKATKKARLTKDQSETAPASTFFPAIADTQPHEAQTQNQIIDVDYIEHDYLTQLALAGTGPESLETDDFIALAALSAAKPASFLVIDTQSHEAHAQNPTHQSVEEFDQDYLIELMLTGSETEIPSAIAPHVPSLDAQVSSGSDASDKKYCNCVNNSPSCIQCHLEEKEDLDELLKQAAGDLPEPQSPVFAQPAVQIPSYNPQKPLPTPDQTPEQQSVVGSLLGKHAREESGPDQAYKIEKLKCNSCQSIITKKYKMRHLNEKHRNEPDKEKITFTPIEVEVTPEEAAKHKLSKAKHVLDSTKSNNKINAEWNFKCGYLGCDKIYKYKESFYDHWRTKHSKKSKRLYTKIPKSTSETQ